MEKIKSGKCLTVVFLILVIAAGVLCSGTDTEAKWWDKFGEPKYGGSFGMAVAMFGNTFDPYMPMMSHYRIYEGMFMPDVTMDREEWSFKVEGFAPKHLGWLAESWEWEDPKTLVVKLRQGVKWHNCAPTHGREFIADDVVYHYDRSLGTGSGFTKPNPFLVTSLGPVKNVTARDRYTVAVNFKEATPLSNWWAITNEGGPNMIESREFVESKDYANYKNAAGTGPFMVADYTAGTSITFSKNPDYYMYDERYPENKLPYIDKVRMIWIQNQATQLAALRSGKVDSLINVPWQHTQSLKKTNPELLFSEAANFALTMDMRLDRKPFNDIRVRRALQLSIDIPTIAAKHYGNPKETNPPTFLSPEYKDWNLTYEEWPEDLKQEYAYNPEKARQLLAEAGYPDGFDTNCYAIDMLDLALVEIIKASFEEIGVNMEIRLMGMQEFRPFTQAGKHDQMYAQFAGASLISPVPTSFLNRTSMSPENNIYAPAEEAAVYDDLYHKFVKAANEAEAQKLGRQMQEYLYRQHWGILSPCRTGFDVMLPRIIGWSGENLAQFNGPRFWARFWTADGK